MSSLLAGNRFMKPNRLAVTVLLSIRKDGFVGLIIVTMKNLYWFLPSEQAPKEYFEALHRQNISWIAAGKEHVDLSRAVEILNKQFGVDRLAVVGGGNINGAFLREGLIDEVSIVVGAGIDGRRDMTAVFDGIDDPSFPTTILRLIGVERVGENSVWLRYAFR